MSVLLHLSDLHFGTERPHVCKVLIQFARTLCPDAIIISGDLTQRATAAQFAAAADFVSALPEVPRLILPGNHDLPGLPLRAIAPYVRHSGSFPGRLDPWLELDDILIVGANSCHRWLHQHGAISRTQVRRVAARLRAAAPTQWKIVVTHHPLLLTSGADWADRPFGHAEALRSWFVAGAELFLNGHVHQACTQPVTTGHDTRRSAHVSQAGTACSSRLPGGKPNSFTVLRQETHGAHLIRSAEHWSWSERGHEFVRSECHPLHALARSTRHEAPGTTADRS